MKSRAYAIASVLIGLTFFMLVVGIKGLDVTNVSFLMTGDAAQHWLGWEFFRHTPALQWPLGKIYPYGIELHNSIVYTDSIPIMAMLFKPFSAFLPAYFQYTGIWLLICFCLQGYFAFKLIHRLTGNNAYSLVASCIFLTSASLLARSGVHFALTGHWLLLYAIYLYFDKKIIFTSWVIILAITSWVHAYLLAMVLVVWAVKIVDSFVKEQISIKAGAIQVGATLIILYIAMYAIGYFTISGGFLSDGFGYYKLNLNSIVNPYHPALSSIIKPLATQKGDYEGLNYLGFGVIFLLIISVSAIKLAGKTVESYISQHYVLIAASLALTLYALSNNITLGTVKIVEFYVPEKLAGLTSAFRASGRFFWVVYYLIFVVAIIGVFKNFKERTAIAILAACLVVQIYDVHNMFKIRRDGFESAQSGYSLEGKSWYFLSQNYKRILTSTPMLFNEDYLRFASYAAANNMSISFGYFARVNAEVWGKQTADIGSSISTGELDPEAIYVFKNKLDYDNAMKLQRKELYTFFEDGVYGFAMK